MTRIFADLLYSIMVLITRTVVIILHKDPVVKVREFLLENNKIPIEKDGYRRPREIMFLHEINNYILIPHLSRSGLYQVESKN